MNAYVAAGASPGDELAQSRGHSKALIEIAGQPMVQWVLSALSNSAHIERVAVVGLSAEQNLHCQKPLTFIPDQGDMLHNALAGLDWVRETDPEAQYALFCSADIPAVTPEMVDWRIQTAMDRAPFDMDYAVVSRQQMERHFPQSNRSYVTFKDAEVCGADMNLLKVDLAVRHDFWHKVFQARKSVLRQASLLGFDMLLLILLRRLTLSEAENRVSKRLDLVGHLQLAPYPELAMDVDNPHQLALMERYLGQTRKGLA